MCVATPFVTVPTDDPPIGERRGAPCREAAFVGESFWLGMGTDPASQPRCALESLARAIFRQHTKALAVVGGEGAEIKAAGAGAKAGPGPGPRTGELSGAGPGGKEEVDSDSDLNFDPSRSGAEWWVQVRHAGDGQDEAVSFHWDKDEDLVDDYGVNVHPAISTVTYLTDTGAPTLVLDHRAPLMYEDLDGFRGHVSSGHLSYPRAGKHVAFDGRLLHGAPRELTRAGAAPPGYVRVSFLVNVWLGYKPRGIQRFPEEELGNLGLSPALGPAEERDIERGFSAQALTGDDACAGGGGEGEGQVKRDKKAEEGKGGEGGGNTGVGGRGDSGGGGRAGTFEMLRSRCTPFEACTMLEYKFGETGTEHLLRLPVPLEALAACQAGTSLDRQPVTTWRRREGLGCLVIATYMVGTVLTSHHASLCINHVLSLLNQCDATPRGTLWSCGSAEMHRQMGAWGGRNAQES
jgi:hypothetical protein